MAIKIQWHYSGEAGFWRSTEGRFEIEPRFIGRVTAQEYVLSDALIRNSDGSWKTTTHYTVTQAKKAALQRVTAELALPQ